jgi:hypothetical protein
MDGVKGKGGYWTIDPTHMEKFKNGAFARGSSSLLRRRPTLTSSSPPPSITSPTPISSSLPDTPPVLNMDYNGHYQNIAPLQQQVASAATTIRPARKRTLTPPPSQKAAAIAATAATTAPVMQIHNLLN